MQNRFAPESNEPSLAPTAQIVFESDNLGTVEQRWKHGWCSEWFAGQSDNSDIERQSMRRSLRTYGHDPQTATSTI